MTTSEIQTTYTTYEVAVAVAAAAAGAALWQIQPTQVVGTRDQRIGLVRLSVALATAVPSAFALVVPNNTPVITTPVAAGPNNLASIRNGGAAPAFGNIGTAWSTAPTFAVAPSNYRIMEFTGAVAGETQVWEWPEGDPFETLFLERSTTTFGRGVCLRNIGAGASAVVTVCARWKEFLPVT